MRNLMWLILGLATVVACKGKESSLNENPVKKTEEENILLPKNRQDLITIKNGQYIEYYPGKKQIKFQGFLDDKEQRDGKWVFFGENGEELTITLYKNGKRHGHTIVKYPNGRLHYVGEYDMDKRTGEWKFYDETGKETVKKF